MRLSDFRDLRHSQEVHPCLLYPDPARRLTTEQVLSYAWPTSFAGPTEHDLCGLDSPRAGWRNAIGSVAWALSLFAKCNGANDNKRTSWHSAPTMKMKTRAEAGRRHCRRVRCRNQTLTVTSHLHHHWMIARYGAGWLAGLVAKATPKTTPTSPPLPSVMSLSNSLNKAEAAAEARKAQEGDAPHADDNGILAAQNVGR